MEHSQFEALLAYLQAHPLIAVALAVLGVMVLGSIIRKLIKAALILALVLLAGLYWTNRQASSDEWLARLADLQRRGEELLDEGIERGRQAVEKGKELQRRLGEGNE